MRLSAAVIIGLVLTLPLAANAATTACDTVAACVLGTNSSSGAGVAGTSASGYGLSGISKTNHGVTGQSASSFGVVGITTRISGLPSTARAGVLGEDESPSGNADSGVVGTSKNGTGVSGIGGRYGGKFTGPIGVLTNNIAVDPYPDIPAGDNADISADGMYVTDGSGGTDTLFAGVGCYFLHFGNHLFCGDNIEMYADGSAFFAGPVTTGSSMQTRMRTATGSDVSSFGARATLPTLEDFGKATLHAGVAHVAIEPIFASTINASAGYMVFITPEGNSRGLYTTQLNAGGFDVRENDGGRATLTFDYRIVAHPADTRAARLPKYEPPSHTLNRISGTVTDK